jgi:GNAT superfamily N-acetyltransferase
MSAVAPVPPRDWTVPPSDVLLADGSIAVIRTVRPEDRQPLLDLHAGVSEDTLRLRFFTASRDAARRYVEHLFDETNSDSAAMVAVVRGRVAGLATAEVTDRERAEVAFLVSDEDHGRGLGILLLEHLAALGRAHGLTRFEAEVLVTTTACSACSAGPGSRSRDGPPTARCPSSCAPTCRPRRSTPPTGASGARRPVRCGPCWRPRASPWSAYVATAAGWAGPSSTRSGRAGTPAGSASCTPRPTRWTACRRTPRSPRCRTPSTSWSWSCRPTRCRT